MGVACCGVERLENGTRAVYTGQPIPYPAAGQLPELQARIDEADTLISFNGETFDAVVLSGAGVNVPPAKHFDILAQAIRAWRAAGNTGRPRGWNLGAVAQANADPAYPSLQRGKTGQGASAPAQWAAGEYEAVIRYCLDGDVAMTADIYRVWCARGYLLLPDGSRVIGKPGDSLTWEPPTKGDDGTSEKKSGTDDSGSGGTSNRGDSSGGEVARDVVSNQASVFSTKSAASCSTKSEKGFSTTEKPNLRLIVSTKNPPQNEAQIGLINSDNSDWKHIKGKPPYPPKHALNPSGKRQIGRKVSVGYEILRRAKCEDCEKEIRLTAGYISATQLLGLERESNETKIGIVKNILRKKAADVDERLVNLRCSRCCLGGERDGLSAVRA